MTRTVTHLRGIVQNEITYIRKDDLLEILIKDHAGNHITEVKAYISMFMDKIACWPNGVLEKNDKI